MKQPAVYVLATYKRGTLYVGVTSDLVKRVWQHNLREFSRVAGLKIEDWEQGAP